MITPSQSRAARAFLKWTVEDAGKRAGIGKNTVVRFESEEGNPQRSSGFLIESAYRAAGVEFPDAYTVRYRGKD
jgi:transcriptional regulator with XRE-family HTH domain